MADRDATDDPRVEVAVRKDGEVYLRVALGLGKATVGRDVKASVQLESKHISRVHFELHVEEKAVRVVDLGSRNGVKVNGERVKNVEIQPKDIVAVPGFQLIFRWLGATEVRRPPKRDTIGGGWDDYLEDGDLDPDAEPEREEITNVTAQHELDPDREMTPKPLGATGSVLNHLAHRRSTGGMRRPMTDDLDEEEDPEVAIAPDIEPLVLRLRDEANSLLYGTNEGDLGVEVIETLDEQISRVALLAPGQTFWWGGTPNMFSRPTERFFPLVAFPYGQEFMVQRPEDPKWEIFHRGEGELDVHRIAGLISCVAQWDDQVEVRYGTFSVYVRCVRRPTSSGRRINLKRLLPSKYVWLALLGSLILHTGFGALPAPRTLDPFRGLGFEQDPDAYVEYMLEAEEPDPEPEPEPEPPPPPPPPPEKAETPEELPKPGPTRREKLGAEKRKKPQPRTSPDAPEDAQTEPEASGDPASETEVTEASPEPPPPKVERKQVSVDSFKVYGMIGHLPELKLSPGQAKRGSRHLLHGIKSDGVVSKAPNLMGINPTGTLSKAQVSKVVNGKTRLVYACYKNLLETHPTAQGRVELRWTVDPSGAVTVVKVLRDTVGSSDLVRCLRETVGKWKFPPPDGGHAQVTFPFTFRRPKL